VKLWANLAGIAVERQQSENLLRASEEKFRTVTQSANDAIISADAQGLVISWNQAAQVMFGYEEREILGRPLAELMPDRYRDAHRMGLERLKTPGAKRQLQRTVELHGLRKNGSEFPLELSLSTWEMKGTSFFTGIIRDITERKQAEEALMKSELRFRLVALATFDAIWDWDMIRNSVEWNDGIQSLFGYKPDTVGPDVAWWIEKIHPEDRTRITNEIHAVIESGASIWAGEYRFRCNDGTYSMVTDRGYVVHDETGTAIRMVGAMNDITERKQAEEALKERSLLAGFDAKISHILTQGENLNEILHGCTEIMASDLGAAFARIWTLNEQDQILELQASSGLYTHLDGPHSQIPVGQLKIGMIASECRPHLTNTVIGDPRVPEQEWAKREGMVAFAGYPLLIDGRVLGVMAMFAHHPLTEFTLQMLESVAGQIAMSIERKRTEKALKVQQVFLRQVIDINPNFVFAKNREGRFTLANQAVADAYGTTVKNLIGKTDADFNTNLEELEYFRRMDLEVLDSQQERFMAEEVITDATGKQHWLQTVKRPLLNEEGVAEQILGFSTDITERKQAEEAIQKAHDQLEDRVQQRTADLENVNHQLVQEIAERQQAQEQLGKSEDHLHALVEALPELIILYRKDGTILEIRAGSEVMTQLIPEECRGKKIEQVFPVDLAESITYYLQRALETKRKQISKYETVRNGKTEYYEVRYIAKSETEVISVVQNISERKWMEEQIRGYTSNLEQLVENRTAEIKQLETQKMANEKLAALGQLAAAVAHEINNPLSGVSNGFLLIKDCIPQDSPVFQYVKIVDQGIDRITKIIEQMYQLYGSGMKNLKLINVDMVVKDVLQLLEKPLNQRDLKAVWEVQADLPEVYLSELGLAQVLTNILQNAIEASPRGSEIKIQTKIEEDCLYLSITDSGSGISPELRGRIFEPFFTTKAGHQKSNIGLGLSVSNSIIEAMGGRIIVDTQFGKGSTFSVVIPMNASVSKIKG